MAEDASRPIRDGTEEHSLPKTRTGVSGLDSTASQEGAADCPVRYHFRLYVAGGRPQSMQAIVNLTELCEKHFKGCYNLEIVDIYKDRAAASRERLLALPTLVKVSPEPPLRIIGDLSDERGVLADLGVIGGGAAA